MCHPSANDLELEYLRHLVACLVFELEDLEMGEELDDNTVICIQALLHRAPVSVMKLVEYIHRHPEDRQGSETYSYAFPFMQWIKPGAALSPDEYIIPPCERKLISDREERSE